MSADQKDYNVLLSSIRPGWARKEVTTILDDLRAQVRDLCKHHPDYCDGVYGTELAAARALLRDLEWCDETDVSADGLVDSCESCLLCHALKGTEHKEDCKLGTFLAGKEEGTISWGECERIVLFINEVEVFSVKLREVFLMDDLRVASVESIAVDGIRFRVEAHSRTS